MDMETKKIALRFADDVIDGTPGRFDCIEIQGVADLTDGDAQPCCEVDNDNPDFFSVYLHLVEGGVICVGDFSELPEAERYAAELGEKYGWDVQNFAPRGQTAVD